MALEAALGRIVSRCLAKQPGDRFQTMAEVRAALEQAAVSPAAQRSSIAVLPFGLAGPAWRKGPGGRAPPGNGRLANPDLGPRLVHLLCSELEAAAGGTRR